MMKLPKVNRPMLDSLMTSLSWLNRSKQSMTVGPITRKVMVNTILAQAAINKLDLEEIIEDLMSELTKRQQQG